VHFFQTRIFSTQRFLSFWGNPGQIMDSQNGKSSVAKWNPQKPNRSWEDLRNIITLWFEQNMPWLTHHPLSCSLSHGLAIVVIKV